MTNEVDYEGVLLPDIERTTKIGNFLRRNSLDELPGLLNVLKGEMSLVGPRPLPTQYLCRYSQEQDRGHDVKTGITCWVQVNGRNASSWEKKFRLDVWYVDNKSFILDLKILFNICGSIGLITLVLIMLTNLKYLNPKVYPLIRN